jgi:hypothetical protein
LCIEEERKEKHSKKARKSARERADAKAFSDFNSFMQYQMVQDFAMGKTFETIIMEKGVSKPTLKNGIKLFREKLNGAYELYMMTLDSISEDALDAALSTSVISDKLKDYISLDDGDLTPAEQLYCYLWVSTGSNDTALKESGFEECLDTKAATRKQMLGMYLREKKNLKHYISLLMDSKLDEIRASKELVQHEILEQIQQCKEALARGGLRNNERGNLLKAIELLGKTVGAFEEKIRVTEVSAADALDNLIEMTKASIKELPEGTPVDERFIPSDEGSELAAD